MAGSRSAADDRIFALALIVVALLALALRAPVAGLPFERDEGEYAYIAQRWFEGDVPYRDAFDQKPPGIFVFYAAAFAAFGESEAAVRWTAQLWALVGIAAIAVLGARIATPAAGVAAALAPIYASVLAAPLALLRSLPSPVAVRPLLWVAGWLVVSLVAVSAGGYFRHHYFALALPPLAVLAGIGLDAFARWALASRRYARWAGAGLALALLGWTVVSDWWYFGPAPAGAKLQRLYGANAFPEAPQLGAWIAANSEPTDRFFVYGSEPQLFFYANRPSASRYIFVYPLTMPLPAAAERQREALADFDAARPLFVVATFAFGSILEQPGTPPELKTGLRERLGRDYDLTAVVPYFEDRSTQILLGDRARAIWEAQPLWDGATPWAAYVVWKRRD